MAQSPTGWQFGDSNVTEAQQFGWSFVFGGLLPDEFPDTRGVVQTPWWRQVYGADWSHPEGPQSDVADRSDHPVVHVSWDDALAYCAWTGSMGILALGLGVSLIPDETPLGSNARALGVVRPDGDAQHSYGSPAGVGPLRKQGLCRPHRPGISKVRCC